jgi:hypothetical protein
MEQRSIDLLICIIEYEKHPEALERFFAERFPRLNIKTANGLVETLLVAQVMDYRATIIVTRASKILSGYYFDRNLRRIGFPGSNIFIYINEPPNPASSRKARENEFFKGQEATLLTALDVIFSVPANDTTIQKGGTNGKN